MNLQRVTLITLGISDLARSKAFYTEFGWHAHHSSTDGIVFFQLNSLVLGLFDLDALAQDQGRPDATLATGAMTLAINFANEAEVDRAYERALFIGGSALKQPQKVFWGGYSGYFADPDGHVWELAHNPFWPLKEDGSLTLAEA